MNIDYRNGEFAGYVVHPNNKTVVVVDCGTRGYDDNSFESSPGYPTFTWLDSGEALTEEEENEVIEDDGDKFYMHEWLYDHAKWE